MIAAVIKESFPGEKRVALIPRNVTALSQAGLDVMVESGAGEASLHADSEYEKAGARVETDRGALLSETDLLLTVRGRAPSPTSHPRNSTASRKVRS